MLVYTQTERSPFANSPFEADFDITALREVQSWKILPLMSDKR